MHCNLLGHANVITGIGDEDADLATLDAQTVAVVGYGNQGRSQALNLRDSGVRVIVGNIRDQAREAAQSEGFDVLPIDEACATADLVMLLTVGAWTLDIEPADI